MHLHSGWTVPLYSWELCWTSPRNFVFTQRHWAFSQREQWHLLSELIRWRDLGEDIHHQRSRTGLAAVLGILIHRRCCATMHAIHSFSQRWNQRLVVSSPPLQVSVGCCCGRSFVTRGNTLLPWTEGHRHWNSLPSAAGTSVVIETSCCCCRRHCEQ